MKTCEDLVAQGLDRYLPQEFARVKQQLNELDKLLARDPLAARDLSLQLAPTISRLPARARQARRQVVRAITESLTRSGFIVDPPRLLRETDEVLVRAEKPAGVESGFSVRLNGTMIYKFDHYEGMKCKNDIDKVLPLLEQVYGIQLSDARILWQNPDRLSKAARPLDLNQRRESHG